MTTFWGSSWGCLKATLAAGGEGLSAAGVDQLSGGSEAGVVRLVVTDIAESEAAGKGAEGMEGEGRTGVGG